MTGHIELRLGGANGTGRRMVRMCECRPPSGVVLRTEWRFAALCLSGCFPQSLPDGRYDRRVWWVIVLVVLLVPVTGYLAFRLVAARLFSRIIAPLGRFIDAVNRAWRNEADFDAVLRTVTSVRGERLTADLLGADFPGQILGHSILAVQRVRNLNRAEVTMGAKLLVRLEYGRGATRDYVFIMWRERRTWKVGEWSDGDEFDMVDIDFG